MAEKKELTISSDQEGYRQLPGFFPIPISNFIVGKELDFEIYIFLENNRKLVLYRGKGQNIDETTVERFKSYAHTVFYVREEEKARFIKYSSEKISSALTDTGLGRKDKIVQIQESMQNLLHTLYQSPAAIGEEAMNQLVDINEQMMQTVLSVRDPYREIMKILKASKSVQDHARNTQALGTFIGMGLGYTSEKALSDMGVAAMMHDIGLSVISKAATDKPPIDLSPKDFLEYSTHPAKSVDIINAQKSKISLESKMIIQQHHERVDGSGFPLALRGVQMFPMSKVFTIVDELDHLVLGDIGLAPMNLSTALKHLQENNFNPKIPDQPLFDKKILAAIGDLFFKEVDKKGVGL